MSEAPRQIAYVLTDESINDLQTNTVQTLIERAKRAHYCNVYLRINGKDELYQADWLKHMKAASVAAVSAPQQPAAQSEPKQTFTRKELIAAIEAERHACSIAVWMTKMDAVDPGADDRGVAGWLEEAEQRIKNRSAADPEVEQPAAQPVIDHAEASGGIEGGPQEDRIEAAYWRFDARRKGYEQWKKAPMSERDAFKAELRNALEAEKVRAEMRLVARGWQPAAQPACDPTQTQCKPGGNPASCDYPACQQPTAQSVNAEMLALLRRWLPTNYARNSSGEKFPVRQIDPMLEDDTRAAVTRAEQQPAAQPALSDEQVQEAMRLADEVASIAAAQYLPGYQQADEDQARAALETYLRGIGR